MPGELLKNATLVELDPPRVERGDLRIRGGWIVERGSDLPVLEGEARSDLAGRILMPGLVCGHTHLYGTLARGMPGPRRAPRNFVEILEQVWWQLDRALDLETVYVSALVGALEAVRTGVTCLIDHHSSPGAIAGSLGAIRRALLEVGLRGILCYEISDRGGESERERGLAETREFLAGIRASDAECRGAGPAERKAGDAERGNGAAERGNGVERLGDGLATYQNGLAMQGNAPAWSGTGPGMASSCNAAPPVYVRGMVGAHASFTLDDRSLEEIGALAAEFGVGVHIHAAEDRADVDDALARHGRSVVERLAAAGCLGPRSILAHGTHLSDRELAMVDDGQTWLVHNPRSNMNNRVGHAPVGRFGRRSALGTDGIGADMLEEARFAFFKAQDAGSGLSANDILRMLHGGQILAGETLGTPLGRLVPGTAADLLVLDYRPPTPLDAENLAGHVLFGMSCAYVHSVMVAGRWVMLARQFPGLDLEAIAGRARDAAARLWKRMESLPHLVWSGSLQASLPGREPDGTNPT